MTNEAGFKPSEIWTPNDPTFELGVEIEEARREMNRKNPGRLIHDLQQAVTRDKSGVVYALLRGERPDEYSDNEALVMFNHFANTATSNMLVRAEFIREAAKQADVRDGNGKLKPVIMLASPGLFGSKLKLSWKDKLKILHGELGPAAREYLKTVSALKYGRIALLGYSQGADMALAGARQSYSANLDASSLSVGDPAGVKDRKIWALASDFFSAAPDIEARAAQSGLEALNESRGIRRDYARFLASSPYLNNLLFASEMASNSFESRMQELIDEGELDKLVVGYGSASKISPREAIEPALARLHEKVHDDRLVSINVNGGTHAWGENLTVLAKLYLKALV